MGLASLMSNLKSGIATVATFATDEEKLHKNAASVATVAGVAVAADKDEVAESSRQWMVDTSDRGTIKVTCSHPHTLAEVLEHIPGAVSAILIEEE